VATVQLELSAKKRDQFGKQSAKQIRTQGLVPAIYYGKGIENIALTVDHFKLDRSLRTEAGMNAIINLDIEGNKQVTIVHEIEEDPLTGKILHVDFMHIDVKQKIKADVPVKIIGTAPGVKKGGILAVHLHHISIKCLPLEIPGHFDIDVSALEDIGSAAYVKEIKVPANVEILTRLDEAVVAVSGVKEEKLDEIPAAGAEAAMPEVIEKGKKDKEGDDAAASAAPAAGKAPAADAKKDAKK
jgi:large subunit ribosomal protein L25